MRLWIATTLLAANLALSIKIKHIYPSGPLWFYPPEIKALVCKELFAGVSYISQKTRSQQPVSCHLPCLSVVWPMVWLRALESVQPLRASVSPSTNRADNQLTSFPGCHGVNLVSAWGPPWPHKMSLYHYSKKCGSSQRPWYVIIKWRKRVAGLYVYYDPLW
jgi:hypothetical protein